MWAIFSHLKSSLSHDTLLLGLVLCWKVWGVRNEQVHGSNAGFPANVVDWCKEFLKAYQRAQCPTSHPSTAVDTVDWIPPAGGFIKINVDMALPASADFFRVSGVARNENGDCLWWFRREVVGRPKPSDGEAIAMLQGARAALSHGHRCVVLETVCLPIFHYLSSSSSSLISFGAILDAVLSLRSRFENLSFSFTRLSGNSIAHSLATAPFISCNEGSSLSFLPS